MVGEYFCAPKWRFHQLCQEDWNLHGCRLFAIPTDSSGRVVGGLAIVQQIISWAACSLFWKGHCNASQLRAEKRVIKCPPCMTCARLFPSDESSRPCLVGRTTSSYFLRLPFPPKEISRKFMPDAPPISISCGACIVSPSKGYCVSFEGKENQPPAPRGGGYQATSHNPHFFGVDVKTGGNCQRSSNAAPLFKSPGLRLPERYSTHSSRPAWIGNKQSNQTFCLYH